MKSHELDSSPKNWLVISYYSQMPGACQAEWVDDRVKALHAKGRSHTMVTSICSNRSDSAKSTYRAPSLSPSDLNYELNEIINRNLIDSKFLLMTAKLVKTLLQPLVWLESRVMRMHGEGRWSWLPTAFLCAFLQTVFNRPGVIYTTGGPASAHLVGIVLGRLLAIPVLCELQDPLVGEGIGRNPLSKRGLAWAEHFIISNATITIFVTSEAAKDAVNRYGHAYANKITYVYPGSWQQTPKSRLITRPIKICYLGSLYQTRNLDGFMAALLRLRDLGVNLKDSFSVTIYGNMNPDIRKRIMAFPEEIIGINSLIPREEALKVAQDSDLLLLIQNTDARSKLTIPFKTYDYLQSGAQILALLYRNPELAKMLEESGHLVCEADNIDAIFDLLQYVLTDGIRSPSIPNMTPYTAAEKMMDLARSCRRDLSSVH